MRSVILCGICMIALCGCASTPGEQTSAASTQPHAECLVCKKNADLACIDVTIDATTPRYDYAGRTYYFCSESCRAKFAANPTHYLEK